MVNIRVIYRYIQQHKNGASTRDRTKVHKSPKTPINTDI